MQDVIDIDAVKTVAIEVRKPLLDVNFGPETSFCDAHQLKTSWKETKILEFLLSFLQLCLMSVVPN